MQDRDDDKYESTDESEYHFSDEDVSYDVESEAPKSAQTHGDKAPLFSPAGLTTSKRMIISLGVFFVLVFVAYKIISPSSPQASITDIKPVVVANTPQAAPPLVVQAAAPATVNAPEVPSPAAAPVPASVQQVVATLPPVPAPAPVVTPPVMAAAPVSAPPTVQSPAPASPGVALPSTTTVAAPASPVNVATAPMVSPTNTMPNVIPVQSPPVTAAPSMSAMATAPATPSVDAKIAALNNSSDQLIGQMQADYSQKVNEFATQNRALQDQIQLLSTRIATMEGQLNQLVQTLTQKQEPTSPSVPPSINMPSQQQPGQQQSQQPPVQASEPRVSYNVQAIIPGRAWLRSDNGETVTVAEGDVIKDLGRITKIDPYDGVVEINVGSKTISLSYGSTA